MDSAERREQIEIIKRLSELVGYNVQIISSGAMIVTRAPVRAPEKAAPIAQE